MSKVRMARPVANAGRWCATFKLYRQIEPGEHFVVGGDCSQGGLDYNAIQFISKTKLDVPLVFHARGVAATMTPQLHQALEKLYDLTRITPTVALERNNGGASEMERLQVLNRAGKYRLYTMPAVGRDQATDTSSSLLGYTTTAVTRPILVGDLKAMIESRAIRLYDEATIRELRTFVISRVGKPEAAPNQHDDLVMSLAIAWQLFQQIAPPPSHEHLALANRAHEELFSDDGWY